MFIKNLILEKNRLIFLTNKKIKKPNLHLLNYILLKIGFINNFNLKLKNNILLDKEIYLGDTDIFITL